MDLLGRLRSPYLLPMIGFCSESNHKLLVYEFMANGGLQEHLYPIGGMCFICLYILFDSEITFNDLAYGSLIRHLQS